MRTNEDPKEDNCMICCCRVCWLSVGKTEFLLPLQRALFRQLTGGAVLPAALTAEARVLQALRQAAAGQRVLLVLDDLTDAAQEKALNPLNAADPGSGRLVCTTRIQRLLGPAMWSERGR